ncbi:MAG: prepilin-type N-terminal cleavage/methylation domain-containing protein [Armatimonadota bacterium]
MLQSLRSNRVRGFTLIEIMVVVLILAILLALAIPAFNKARETTRTKACVKNLREIDDAKDQYAMENRLTSGANVEISDLLPQYLKATPVCPSGGTYTCNPVGVSPQCSIPGHEL